MGEVDEPMATAREVHRLNQEHSGCTLYGYALPQRADALGLRLLRRLSAEHRTIQFASRVITSARQTWRRKVGSPTPLASKPPSTASTWPLM